MTFYDIITNIRTKMEEQKKDGEWLHVTKPLVEFFIETEPKETIPQLLALTDDNKKKLVKLILKTRQQLQERLLNCTKENQNKLTQYQCEFKQHEINPDFIKPIAPDLQLAKTLGLRLCIVAHELTLAMIVHVTYKGAKSHSLSNYIPKMLADLSIIISLYGLSKPKTWSKNETLFVLNNTLFNNKEISTCLTKELYDLTELFLTTYKETFSERIQHDDAEYSTLRP